MMMNKKGVSAVIANVLIILLVVAAVAILGAIIKPTIEGAKDEIESSTACQQLNMEILSCTSAEAVVYRGAGGQELTGKPIVIVEGGSNCVGSEDIGLLESKTVSCTASPVGKTLRAGLKQDDGTVCEAIGSEFGCS
jgi:5,10-methylene-tetrahydrofolate dehydrogenase/methenyl tetrahydrofolate cyclohydrolase